jgi:hypothetical protein
LHAAPPTGAFIRFFNVVERDIPNGKLIEAVHDTYATHRHPKVCKWLAWHPRRTFHSPRLPARG